MLVDVFTFFVTDLNTQLVATRRFLRHVRSCLSLFQQQSQVCLRLSDRNRLQANNSLTLIALKKLTFFFWEPALKAFLQTCTFQIKSLICVCYVAASQGGFLHSWREVFSVWDPGSLRSEMNLSITSLTARPSCTNSTSRMAKSPTTGSKAFSGYLHYLHYCRVAKSTCRGLKHEHVCTSNLHLYMLWLHGKSWADISNQAAHTTLLTPWNHTITSNISFKKRIQASYLTLLGTEWRILRYWTVNFNETFLLFKCKCFGD